MAGDRAAKRGRHKVELERLAALERQGLADRGVQLALMPASDPEQPEAIAPAAPGRRPGRPAGAGNLAPREFAEYLVRMGGDVVLRAVRIANADTVQLAYALQCTRLEAAQLQRAYADIAAPYQHQALPKALEIEGDAWAGFLMVMGGVDRAGNVDPALQARSVDVLAALSGPAPKSEDIQGLSGEAPAVSDTPSSDTSEE